MLIENKLKLNALAKLGIYNFLRSRYIGMTDFFYGRKYRKMMKNGFAVDAPETFVIEPTSRCNLNCKMCYLKDHKAGKKEMTLDEFRHIVDGIPTMKYVIFTGGEIFTRPDFVDMVEFLKSRGIKTLLTTNGTLITGHNIDRICGCSNIVSVVISIDGKKETHNKIRGWEKAFDRSSTAIKLLQKKFFVNVVCVLQDTNIKEIPDVVRWAAGMGLRSVIFEYERKYTKNDIEEARRVTSSAGKDMPLSESSSDRPEFSLDELKVAIRSAKDAADGTGVKVYFLPKYFEKELDACYSRSRRKNGRYFCRLLFRSRIDAQGNMIHCYAVRKLMGNLLEKPFAEIWNSEEYKRFRKALIDNNMLPVCENCLYLQRV